MGLADLAPLRGAIDVMVGARLAVRMVGPTSSLPYFSIDKCLPRSVVRMTSYTGCNIPQLGVHMSSPILSMGLVETLNSLFE
ncbi:hypothetical protein J1N35_018093 [Gossypium stocksii]|uniref:Uncharacterized protein n=1 Tax=Gossypium stocksii TaxID=47602 RepID=A0A9D4A6V3_9ROSI|nr:hypothetical protein J1N35_018093 [Gossypium stocksii]